MNSEIKRKLRRWLATPQPTKLYRCQSCGHVDHDEQDGTGHWEQGTSEHEWGTGWSYWILSCSKCGAIGEMPLVSP